MAETVSGCWGGGMEAGMVGGGRGGGRGGVREGLCLKLWPTVLD